MKKSALLCFFVCLNFAIHGQQCDLDNLRTQAVELLITDENISTDEAGEIDSYINSQNSNGSWTDVDYDDTDQDDDDQDDTSWDPIDHLKRLVMFCQAYADYSDFTGSGGNASSEELRNGINTGLEYWYGPANDNSCNSGPAVCPCAQSCPCSENWWWNWIGKQRELQDIGILFYDELVNNQNLLNSIIGDLPLDIENCRNNSVYTGANLVDVASSIIVNGLLSGDETLVTDGKTAFESGLQFAEEGIRHDYSFHQHGPLLYNGGYGMSFLENVAFWGAVFTGDAGCDYDPEGKERLFEYVLQGTRWMTIDDLTDYSANGRDIARVYPNNNAGVDKDVMKWIIKMAYPAYNLNDPDDPQPPSSPAIELWQMKGKIEAEDRQNISGSKYFPKSDYVVHHRNEESLPQYFSSVKMCSGRTIGTESLIGENKRGFWLPYGCTFVYLHGNEYENIFPYWDWMHVPGVTSPTLTTNQPDYLPEFEGCQGETLISTQNTEFVGAANNEDYSVSAMDYVANYDGDADPNWEIDNDDCVDLPDNIDIETVSGKKAWFHFGDEIIALGADIATTQGEVHTTIDQSISVTSYDEEGSDASTEWVKHNGIAYILPNSTNQSWDYSLEPRQGNWNIIGDESVVANGEVFKIFIDHQNINSYYYIIAPGKSGSDYDLNNNPITLLENSSARQAIKKDNGLAGIVYYPDNFNPADPLNNIQVTDFAEMKTNRPCALLYDENKYEVCISSPDRKEDRINLTIETTDGTTTTMSFEMPTGHEAGTSRCHLFSDFGVSQSCNEPHELQFNALFHDDDGPNLGHSWTIEGGALTGVVAFGSGQSAPIFDFSPPHTFVEGEYTITHTITLNGVMVTSTQDINVLEIDHPNGITVIAANEVWNANNQGSSEIVIAGTLTIAPGASLTIAGDLTVMFCGENSRLVIEPAQLAGPGGKLILNGTLTDYQSQTWHGVEVGGRSFANHTSTLHGQLFSNAGAEIRNARIAIRTGKSFPSINQNGGKIRCTQTTFLNNAQSIVIPSHNTPNYQGDFFRCNFVVDDDYLHSSFRDFIHLTRVDGITIKGCTFTNDMDLSDIATEINDWGKGISASDAGFEVVPWSGIPSQGMKTNVFNNLGYAISARRKGANRSFKVQQAEFNDCFVGIRNRNVNASEIVLNTFYLGRLPQGGLDVIEPVQEVLGYPGTVQSGVVYEGTIEGFECQGNNFMNTYRVPTPDHLTVGVFCHNTGDINKSIRLNTFDWLNVGNLAVGDNGADPMSPAQGLTYLCNTNTNIQENGFDIDVAQQDGTTTQSLVRLGQGFVDDGIDRSAANVFTDPENASPATGFAYSGPDNISYWRFGNDPVPSDSPDGSVLPVDKAENTCPTEYCYPPCSEPPVNINDVKSEYHSTKAAYYLALEASYQANPKPGAADSLSRYRFQMDKTAFTVVEYYLEDTTNTTQDSLFAWIRHLDNTGALLWLSNEYLAQGDGTSALAMIDAIPVNYSLTSEQAEDIANYRYVTNLLIGKDLDSLSSTALTSLAAYDKSGGQTEIWVKGILTDYGSHYPPEYSFTIAGAGAKHAPETEGNDQKHIVPSVMTVAPNPAKDYVRFTLALDNEEMVPYLEVRDLNGRVVYARSDLGSVESTTWYTENLPSGIYFYQLLIPGEVLQSGKIILTK